MYALLRLAENGTQLTIGRTFVLTFQDPNLKSLVISLNKDQLQMGKLSNDSFIPFEYSRVSVEVYGKRPGRWTLFDTGQLYDSFKILSVNENFIVEFGDLEKEDKNFEELFDGNVLGLDGESISILIDEALPVMQEVILDTLFRGIS